MVLSRRAVRSYLHFGTMPLAPYANQVWRVGTKVGAIVTRNQQDGQRRLEPAGRSPCTPAPPRVWEIRPLG